MLQYTAEERTMTRTTMFAMFLLVFFWGFTPLKAQQEGSVEIAKSVTTTPVLVDGPVNCLETAAKVLPAKDAAKFCLDAAKIEADRAKRVANEAADATKASRPQVISPYGGYSRYGGWGYNRGFIGGGVVISGGRTRTRVIRERVVRDRQPRQRVQRIKREWR